MLKCTTNNANLHSLLITHTAVRERERERKGERERERGSTNPILCQCMLDYLVGDLIEHIVCITEMPYTCVSPQYNGSVRTHIVCFDNKLKLSGFSYEKYVM